MGTQRRREVVRYIQVVEEGGKVILYYINISWKTCMNKRTGQIFIISIWKTWIQNRIGQIYTVYPSQVGIFYVNIVWKTYMQNRKGQIYTVYPS